MPARILMPALSPTMEEGTLLRWLKSEGEPIESGEPIAEIETDKATMEVEAVEEGRLGKILVPEGSAHVKVNAVIGVILEEDEDASALESLNLKTGDGAGDEAKGEGAADDAADDAESAAADATARQSGTEPETGAGAGRGGNGAAPPEASARAGGRIFASPLARRLAREHELDLAAMSGSGPHGRIVKRDIEQALETGSGRAAPEAEAAPSARSTPAAPAAAVATGPDARAFAEMFDIPFHAEPASGMRRTVAQRLSESKQTVPHFYLTVDIALDPLLAARRQINADLAGEGVKLSVNDFLIKACATALREVPAANAGWGGDEMVYFDRQDISVAVATEGGLITPIIKDAGAKGLRRIAAEMGELADKARKGRLAPTDYQGGTFSLSNLGMYGVREFSAIINPPQGCLLAVGAGEQRPVVRDGELTVATLMSGTLSCDHRVVDGAVGAQFLAALKGIVENPVKMLL